MDGSLPDGFLFGVFVGLGVVVAVVVLKILIWLAWATYSAVVPIFAALAFLTFYLVAEWGPRSRLHGAVATIVLSAASLALIFAAIRLMAYLQGWSRAY